MTGKTIVREINMLKHRSSFFWAVSWLKHFDIDRSESHSQKFEVFSLRNHEDRFRRHKKWWRRFFRDERVWEWIINLFALSKKGLDNPRTENRSFVLKTFSNITWHSSESFLYWNVFDINLNPAGNRYPTLSHLYPAFGPIFWPHQQIQKVQKSYGTLLPGTSQTCQSS